MPRDEGARPAAPSLAVAWLRDRRGPRARCRRHRRDDGPPAGDAGPGRADVRRRRARSSPASTPPKRSSPSSPARSPQLSDLGRDGARRPVRRRQSTRSTRPSTDGEDARARRSSSTPASIRDAARGAARDRPGRGADRSRPRSAAATTLALAALARPTGSRRPGRGSPCRRPPRAGSRRSSPTTTRSTARSGRGRPGRRSTPTRSRSSTSRTRSWPSRARSATRCRGPVDVSTLTDWLDLNAAYDAALRHLYQALVDSKGRVTDEVRAAFDGREARPASSCRPTRRALVDHPGRDRPGRAQPGRHHDRGGAGRARRGDRAARRRRAGRRRRADAERDRTAPTAPARDARPRSTLPTTDPDGAARGAEPNSAGGSTACNCVSSPTSRGTSRPTSSSIPIVGEPAFDGPLGELDRRAGGELQALDRVRGAHGQALLRRRSRPPASCRPGRVVTVGAGDAAKLDRETVVRIGAVGRAPARRPRRSTSLAIWLVAARRRPRRWRSGRRRSSSPAASSRARTTRKTIYREDVEARAAGARRADPRRARRGRRPR